VWIIVIAALVVALILLEWHRTRLAAVLLVPYFLWLCFATYLNATIWMLNP
jgi:translocator protein